MLRQQFAKVDDPVPEPFGRVDDARRRDVDGGRILPFGIFDRQPRLPATRRRRSQGNDAGLNDIGLEVEIDADDGPGSVARRRTTKPGGTRQAVERNQVETPRERAALLWRRDDIDRHRSFSDRRRGDLSRQFGARDHGGDGNAASGADASAESALRT